MFKERFLHYLENNDGDELDTMLRVNYNTSYKLLIDYLNSNEIKLEKVIFLLDELIEDKEYLDAFIAVKLFENMKSRE